MFGNLFKSKKSALAPRHIPVGGKVGMVKATFPLVACAGKDAHTVISDLAKQRDVTPIVMGGLRSVEMMVDMHMGRHPQEILYDANSFNFDTWISAAREKAREIAEETGVPYPHPGQFEGPSVQTDAIAAAVSAPLRPGALNEAYIGVFQTADPTEVPAILDCGGWNDFPMAEVHVGLHRRWRDRDGARLIGHSHDLLTFHVLRPPNSQNEAFALAEEQFAYCPDIIQQGYGSLGRLAGALLGSRTWQLWWD